mmetsp:Transcript_48716/g.150445  ORF Transcript_48716/g.150445 Transcript_48716/m.150445 type:complete len:218 (+) Transcript_48716:459-1112(+)
MQQHWRQYDAQQGRALALGAEEPLRQTPPDEPRPYHVQPAGDRARHCHLQGVLAASQDVQNVLNAFEARARGQGAEDHMVGRGCQLVPPAAAASRRGPEEVTATTRWDVLATPPQAVKEEQCLPRLFDEARAQDPHHRRLGVALKRRRYLHHVALRREAEPRGLLQGLEKHREQSPEEAAGEREGCEQISGHLVGHPDAAPRQEDHEEGRQPTEAVA